MRVVPWLVLVGCGGSDTTAKPLTVAHVTLTESCDTPPCKAEPLYPYTGICDAPLPLIDASTKRLEMYTLYEPEDLAGFVQAQYEIATDSGWYFDGILRSDDGDYEVFGAYDVAQATPLYRVTAAGDIVTVDTTRVSAMSGRTLQFQYSATTDDKQRLYVIEDHVVDDPRSIEVYLDHPTIFGACCTAGRPGESALVILALLGILRRRSSAARS